MNTVTKFTLTALTIATLAGCASAPVEAPKTEAERIASGSLLNVPVDISKFPSHKQKIVADNGDEGRITVFVDPKTGKSYDLDGQPVNEKGERVLADGQVCNPLVISFNMRGFGTSLNPRYECWTSAKYAYVNNDNTKEKAGGKIASSGIGALAAINPIAAVGALVATGVAIASKGKTEVQDDDMPDTY